MKYLILVCILFLSACGHTPVKPEPPVVKEIRYIVKLPPAESLQFPAKVEKIDVDTASQAEASKWVIDKEEYTRALENKIISIGKFFKDEQAKADAEAKKAQ